MPTGVVSEAEHAAQYALAANVGAANEVIALQIYGPGSSADNKQAGIELISATQNGSNEAAGELLINNNGSLSVIGYWDGSGVHVTANADGNTYKAGHLILPSTATPASPQTINSVAAATVTGCTGSVAAAGYLLKAIVQYVGAGAAGVPNFQIGLGSGAAATILWGNAVFHDAVAGTSGYVARPTAFGPFAGPTLSTNNWMMTFDGYALFTAPGTASLQAWTSIAADTYQIKNAIFELIPV
jgi:hypothetical protein